MCSLRLVATHLAIDRSLLEHACRVSGSKSNSAVVTQALQEFIARREQKKLRDLFGAVDWDPAYNHTRERSRR